MKSIENGAFAPIELISVGLTNTPNIPGNAIANAHNNQEHPTNTLMTDSEPTVNQIKQLKDENQRLSQSIKDFDEQNQLLKNQNYALETSLSNAQLAYDKGKKEKIHMLLSLKTKEGFIHSNEYTYWANALENNFDEALNNLSKKTQILNTRCQTLNLKQNATLANSKNRLIALVNERIHQTGEAYSIAWSKIKQKHTELSL